jgi:peptidyl-tRNA hydrolase, PTH1 family
MRLIVGLGNPGPKHVANRHNVGFMAVQAIASRHGIGPWRRRFQGVACEGPIGGARALLLLPGTYMNESGRAVAEAMHFYKLSSRDVVVIHDEVDLPPAKVRVKFSGTTDAGHNGLRSISSHISHDYWRVRVGVGRPPGARVPVHVYVLNDFAKSEHPWVTSLCEITADNAELLMKDDPASFQNKVHLAMQSKGFYEPNDKEED